MRSWSPLRMSSQSTMATTSGRWSPPCLRSYLRRRVMIQVDQAKLNEIIKAAVAQRFATSASVAKLFDLQRESAFSDFPNEALILNFQLARSDYDRARQDTVS